MRIKFSAILTAALALGLLVAAAAALAAPPAAPALAAEKAKPAAPAKAAQPAPVTFSQYLRGLPPAEQAEAKAIMAKRGDQRQDLRAKVKALSDEMKAMWKQPKFDQAQFLAKGKELSDLGRRLGLLRMEDLAELRTRFGPQLPMPKSGR